VTHCTANLLTQHSYYTSSEFWAQAVHFSVTYASISNSFPLCPLCHKKVLIGHHTNLTMCFLLMELTGRSMGFTVKMQMKHMMDYYMHPNKQVQKSDHSGLFATTKVCLKWVLVLHIALISLFIRLGGCNVCTCLYMSNSITVVVDVLAFLVNCDLQNCVEKSINANVLRKILRIRRLPKQAERIFAYTSDSIEDFHSEVTILARIYINNFANVLRLLFTAFSLIFALRRYGVQFHVTLLCLNTTIRLMFHVLTFISGLVDISDTWECYSPLSDQEAKPYVKQLAVSAHVHKTSPCKKAIKFSEGDECPLPRLKRCKKKRKCLKSTKHSSNKVDTSCEINGKSTAKDNCNVDAKIFKSTEEEVELCSICLSAQNMETVKLNTCQHRFHEGCLLRMLRIAGQNNKIRKCPLCRAHISAGQIEEDVMFDIPHI
jgi:hypothetical protein